MAQVDLSGEAYPLAGFVTARVALNAVAATVTQITLPTWCKQFTLTLYESNGTTAEDGKLSDALVQGNDWYPLRAGADLTMPILSPEVVAHGSAPSIYVTADSNSAVAQILMQVARD